MVRISEVVLQNPWWKHGKKFVQFDKNLQALAANIAFTRKQIELNKGNIYVLRGPRQVGKTTYIKKLISELIDKGINPSNILYLSSDFFISRRELRNAITYFLNKNVDASELYLFIDEITSVKDWSFELKYLSDSGIMKKAVVMATGSSAVALRKEGELLPGRGLEGNEHHMRPLTFRDFVLQTTERICDTIKERELRNSMRELRTVLEKNSTTLGASLDPLIKSLHTISPFKQELEYLFNLYLRCGGYPFAISNFLAQEQKTGRFSTEARLSEILMRDVIGDITKLGKQDTVARQLLREISNKYGSRYSFSKLAGDVGITHVTTIDYLEILEESFILTILYAINLNEKEPKFKGDKKIYFQDPFVFYSVQSYLTGKDVNEIIDETLEDEESTSKVVEALVSTHLATNQEIPLMREPRTFLWFYYNTRGKEIDNVLRTNGSYFAIEVKYQKGETTEVLKIPQVERSIVLTKDNFATEERTISAPVDMFLALLEKSLKTM
jgi:predicted AAA+ superfamily ATPase